MSHFILSKEVAYKKIERMAYEIVERNMEEDTIILAGIKNSGLIIASILYKFLKKIFKGEIIIVTISIDKKEPKSIALTPLINFDNEVIILIDDVSNSGKTLLYAMKPFLEFYPKKIQTLVLVERSYKEFPISPDYVGLSVATALSERIVVETAGGEILGATINQ
ncbi:MAG: phosphoribosyltransferase family protein [Ginsengibacter sp.]|jgi:pyrimidine operon attenuation protein/uracil phosphoribosyltransferase